MDSQSLAPNTPAIGKSSTQEDPVSFKNTVRYHLYYNKGLFSENEDNHRLLCRRHIILCLSVNYFLQGEFEIELESCQRETLHSSDETEELFRSRVGDEKTE